MSVITKTFEYFQKKTKENEAAKQPQDSSSNATLNIFTPNASNQSVPKSTNTIPMTSSTPVQSEAGLTIEKSTPITSSEDDIDISEETQALNDCETKAEGEVGLCMAEVATNSAKANNNTEHEVAVNREVTRRIKHRSKKDQNAYAGAVATRTQDFSDKKGLTNTMMTTLNPEAVETFSDGIAQNENLNDADRAEISKGATAAILANTDPNKTEIFASVQGKNIRAVESPEIQAQLQEDYLDAVCSENSESPACQAALIDTAKNIGGYHKNAQLEIDASARQHDTKDELYNVTASNYLHEMDAENQQEVVKRTQESGNEEALNNIAKNLYNYDGTNFDFIKEALEKCGYDSVMKTLDKIQKEQEQKLKETEQEAKRLEEKRKAQEEAEAKAAQEKAEIEIEEKALQKIKAEELEKVIKEKAKTTTEKAKIVKALKDNRKNTAIKSIVESATLTEIKGLALSGVKTEILNYLINNPSIENNEKLEIIKPFLNKYQKEQLEQIEYNRQHPKN